MKKYLILVLVILVGCKRFTTSQNTLKMSDGTYQVCTDVWDTDEPYGDRLVKQWEIPANEITEGARKRDSTLAQQMADQLNKANTGY